MLVFVIFLFLGVGVGCGLRLWQSLDFSINCLAEDIIGFQDKPGILTAKPGTCLSEQNLVFSVKRSFSIVTLGFTYDID